MKERKSNFELMRIISMLMIIMWHLIRQGGILDNSFTTLNVLLKYITTLLVIHVNSFVLLTGYFQCNQKFKFSKFLKLIGLVWFYKITFLIVTQVCHLKDLTTLEILKNLSPINYGDYWFLQIYVLLYLISPILNRIINNINKKQFQKYLLVLFFIISILATLTMQKGFNNSYGYSLSNFILLYFIGAYLRLYPINIKIISHNLKQILLIFGFCTLGFISLSFHYFSLYIQDFNSVTNYISQILGNMYCYDSPLVILQAILYFLFFKNLNIKSNKIINKISTTTLGIYLIHTNRLIRSYIYKYFGFTPYMKSSVKILIFVVIHSIVLFILCSIIELIRISISSFLSKRNTIKKIGKKLKDFVDSLGFNLTW